MYKPYNLKDVIEASSKKKFTVVSTFAGGGGSSTGYRLAGGDILCVNEFVGEAVSLNPLWIIFALSLGGKFFGIIGVLIAIPLAAIIGVIIRYWFSSVFTEN